MPAWGRGRSKNLQKVQTSPKLARSENFIIGFTSLNFGQKNFEKRPPTFFRVFYHWIYVFKFRAPNFGQCCRPIWRPNLFSLILGHHWIYDFQFLSLDLRL